MDAMKPFIRYTSSALICVMLAACASAQSAAQSAASDIPDILTFLRAMIGQSWIEIAAFGFGIANIVLLARRNIWNYPFGLIMVSLYAWIFYDAKLYSDMLLQPFFFVVQVLGWWWWLSKREAGGAVIVDRMAPIEIPIYAAIAGGGILAVGGLMSHYTDAALPYWDAATSVLSVIAQTLLARRKLENWIVWIVVDVMAIGIYSYKGLYPTAALYTIFLGVATIGFFVWRKAETDAKRLQTAAI